MLGDVIETLKRLDQERKFDVILADPPYNIGKDFGISRDAMQLQKYLAWTKQWIHLSLAVLADQGLMYVYGIPEILARIAAEYPLERQRILAWHYTNKTTPSARFWQRSYESIMVLWKHERPVLAIDQIREPYTSSYLQCAGKARKATKGRFGSRKTTYQVHEKGALPRDVIKVPALAGGAGRSERHFMCRTCGKFCLSNELKVHAGHDLLRHPTQKPMALTRKLLQSRITGNKGRVLFPFAGSGSECVVAKSLRVEFLGIENNPDYVEYATAWLGLIGQDHV